MLFIGAPTARQLLALRQESNGGACFSLAKNGEPRPAALSKLRTLGAIYLVTAGRFLVGHLKYV